MKIAIGADFIPTQSNKELFIQGNIDELFGQELKIYLQSCDYRIFNLETPLTDELSPINKYGIALAAPTATANAYVKAGADMFTLANNHIMDQGEQGLQTTINTLRCNNIAYLGAGSNLAEAEKPHIFHLDEKKIGIYACTEHEFSIADDEKGGANPFDFLKTFDHISDLKKECDYIIVLYHGGKEHYRYPSPNLQKICRKFVEKGADLVVCQHSHCIGCEEKYEGGVIVYGQGNFLFAGYDNAFWETSILIQIGDNFEITYVPLMKNGNGVRLANAEEANLILQEFIARSNQIKENGFVEKKYGELAASTIENYLLLLSGKKSFVFRALNKLSGHRFGTWWLAYKYKKVGLLKVWNFFDCEAHRELILKGLADKSKG